MCTTYFCLVLATLGQDASQPGSILRASSDPAPATANQASLARMVEDLGKFDLSLGSDAQQKLSLSCEPVLRWNYPIRNLDDGAVFVWLGKERPEAIATVMSYRDARQNPRRAFEFLSISQERLSAVKAGDRLWQPDKPGFTWRSVPDAPAPAATAAQRRRQMHDLAAKFSVSVESDKNRYELRLLSQPLYRYQNAEAGILDGALFALAEGTDPELILGIESPVEGAAWKYAVGRMTRWAIEVRYREKVVSEFEQITGPVSASDVYHISDAGPLEASR